MRFIYFVFLFFPCFIFSQSISGTVLDIDNKTPLQFCLVELIQDFKVINQVYTDSVGQFNMPISDDKAAYLKFIYVGYNSELILAEILKEEVYTVYLEPAPYDGIVPTITSKISRASSDLLISKSFFDRIPGAFNDPSRLLIRFPAISSPHDGANQVIVKGLPPHLAKWSINNAFIVNPNHLSNAGSITDQASPSGGGTNMISGNSIKQFEFNAAPLNASLFNSATGISNTTLDIPQVFKYSIGILGLEASFAKEFKHGFYIGANYRYSTLGLLSAIGVDLSDEVIKFQDFHFKLGKKIKNHAFQYNYLTGNNSNYHESKKDSSENYKDLQLIDFRGSQNIHSLSHQFVAGKMRFKNAINYSGRQNYRSFETMPFQEVKTWTGTVKLKENIFSAHSDFSYLLNQKFALRLASAFNQIRYQFFDLRETVDFSHSILLLPGIEYYSVRHEVDIAAGISLHNKSTNLELRLKDKIKLTKNQFVILNWSYQATSISPEILLLSPDLQALNSIDGSVNYIQETRKSYFMLGAFAHSYSNLPYLQNTSVSYFDRLDLMIHGIKNDYTILQDGTAFSYGLISQFETIRKDHWQILLSGSIYDTKVRIDFVKYSPTYNFNYTASSSLSYIFKIGKKELILGGGFQMRGAEWINPIDMEESAKTNLTTFDLTANKTKYTKPFTRVDFKIDYLFGRNKRHVISFDIQNLLNQKNYSFTIYDPLLGGIFEQTQLGLIPIFKFSSSF